MRTFLFCFSSLLVMAALLGPFIYITGNPAIYFTYTVLPGQAVYVLSKLCALLALLCISLQAISGLLGTSFYQYFSIRKPASFHRNLGLTSLGLIIGHIVLFTVGVSIRSEKLATQYLGFNFGDYYHAMISIGFIAFILIVIGTGGRLLKDRFVNASLWLHRINLVAIGLIFFHAYQVGTETRFASVSLVMLAFLLILLFSITKRLIRQK